MEEFCKTVRDIVQRAYWRIDKIYTGEKCMKIIDRLREDGIHISFEIFPPKTDAGYDKVIRAAEEMAGLKPEFISVTYGAAVPAKTQQRSHPISNMICT